MNHITLKGNLTRDPELKYITSGAAVVNFTVAVSRHFKRANGEKDKETTFIPCEAWEHHAENISKLVGKGDPILIEGSLKNDTWEKDGEKRSSFKVRVFNFDRLYRAPKQEVVSEKQEKQVEEPEVAAVGAGEDIPF